MIQRGSKIFVASSNQGKIDELKTLLADYELQIISPLEVQDYKPPIEDGADFKANALIKARSAVLQYALPAIADDSGLCCLGLDGEPGVQTARFGGDISYDEKAKLLWQKLQGKDKSAHFACAIAVATMDGKEQVFSAETHGQIIYPAQSKGGWGYDPYFIPEGYEGSFASLTQAEKNRISHRGKALAKMLASLFGKE